MSAVRDAICKHLQADGDGVMTLAKDVYPKMAVEGAEFPFVVVQTQTPPTAIRTFQRVICEQSVFLVKAIDQNTSPKRAADINRAIRARLDQADLTIEGQNSLGIIWVQDIDMVEEFNGQIFHHEGGLYEIYAEEA